MSVVAAKVYEDDIVICADSIIVRGWTKRSHQKLFQCNGVTVGGVGYSAENEMMRLFIRTHKPKGHTEDDIIDFMQEFSSWKKNRVKEQGNNNSYLLIFEGHLFHIESDGLIYEIEEGDFSAIGAGEDFALAAMYCDRSPKKAVQVACELSCMVCEPIIEYRVER